MRVYTLAVSLGLVAGLAAHSAIAESAGTLEVKVVRAGKPVAGAKVTLSSDPKRPKTTSASGKVTFHAAPYFSTVRAEKDGLSGEIHVSLEPGETEHGKIELLPAMEVTGVVDLAPDGGPLPHVRVASRSEVSAPETETDAAGRYRLQVTAQQGKNYAGNPYAAVDIAASAPGLIGDHDAVVILDGGTQAVVDLHMWKAIEVSGRVVDEHGAPVAGARVGLYVQDARPQRMHLTDRDPDGSADTGPDGTFKLSSRDGLPQGRPARLEVWHPEHPRFAQSGPVDAAPIEVRLEAGAILEVVITDPDAGRVTTGCLQLDGNGCYFANDAGVFRGGWHEPGDVGLKLIYSGYANEPEANVTIAPRSVTHVELHTGARRPEVRVQVVDSKGKPVAGAEIEEMAVIFLSSHKTYESGQPIATADSSGRAVIERPHSDVMKLRASRGERHGKAVKALPGTDVRLVVP